MREKLQGKQRVNASGAFTANIGYAAYPPCRNRTLQIKTVRPVKLWHQSIIKLHINKQILVLYTGGTIGMERSVRAYVPSKQFESKVTSQLAPLASGLPQYDVLTLDKLIDSANLCLDDWTHLAAILAEKWAQYDGFVILHGTDTMAYTASALSFLLSGINKPVILTGSQIPLSETRNDALDNLIASLLFAADEAIAEVCIYFNAKLLRGNRSTKFTSTALNAFCSPHFPPLAEVGIETGLRKDLLLKPGKPDFKLQRFSSEAVMVAQIYPGIHAGIVEALLNSGDVKALVLRSYGAGNVPDANTKLIASLAKAHDQGLVIVNLSQCPLGRVDQGIYAAGEILNRIGVVSGGDFTLEAAFAKLHFLIAENLSPENIRLQFSKALCGECS